MLARAIIIAVLAIILLPLILVVFLLVAFLRFGAIIEYSDAGIKLWAKVVFLKFQILGKENVRRKKKKKPKRKKKKKKNIDFSVLKPGSLREVLETLKTVRTVLDRLRRKLLIKQLTLYYIAAGDDAANTAKQFGAVCSAFETITPIIKRNFKIKRLDLRASADFTSSNQKIYAKLNITIAVWEVIYIALALIPFLFSAFKKNPKTEETEEVQTNVDKVNASKEVDNDEVRKDGGKDNG